MTGRAGHHEDAARLGIACRIARITQDQDPPGPQASGSTIGRGAARDHGEPRRIEVGGHFGTSLANDLDQGIPRACEARGQEALALGSLQSYERVAPIEEDHQFRIDLLIIPDFRDQ
jgi:hypothetical protein